tara:strand:- start:110 stop:451 length:342 start_codon:yes stop_codon:yes gene_type:complete
MNVVVQPLWISPQSHPLNGSERRRIARAAQALGDRLRCEIGEQHIQRAVVHPRITDEGVAELIVLITPIALLAGKKRVRLKALVRTLEDGQTLGEQAAIKVLAYVLELASAPA